jgi:hypothetical protein
MDAEGKKRFYTGMFNIQVSYLHHRLGREPWWGMDYGLGNFTMLKAVGKFGPGVRMDLDEIPWRAALAACWEALQRHGRADGREAFVADLWGRFGARWLAAYPVFEEDNNAHDWFGCFRYHHDPAGNMVDLHFANRLEPASPFERPEDRRDDLRCIIKDIEARGLKPAEARFDTWMNSLKPITDLFPASHAASLKACEEFPKGYGWWGQFITKDGGINPRRAQVMQAEGRFEFKRLAGSCPWADFKRKIEGA